MTDFSDHEGKTYQEIDPYEERKRFLIDTLEVTQDSVSVNATVTLARFDARIVGNASGGADDIERIRTIANATLVAVNELYPHENQYVLINAQKMLIEERVFYFVSVSSKNTNGHDILCGISIVNQDDNLTIVKATLSAINRKLERLWKIA